MPTAATSQRIAAEFDEIARLSPTNGDLSDAEAWVLRNLPSCRGTALEIGCGVGDLSRLLSSRFAATHAIDLSSGMIAEAKRRTPPGTPLEFFRADMFEWLGSRRVQYDCIVTVTTLHHVDFRFALAAMAQSLRPGGRLLVVDVVDRSARRYVLLNAAAAVVGALREFVALLRRRSSLALRHAYRLHGQHETYLTSLEVRASADLLLPGSTVSSTLFWRYRLIWEKSASSFGATTTTEL
jgi:2-polyprenyl-3-methyl-5-hydroxy-6-metoxy-1,4-benzoquinol methylase